VSTNYANGFSDIITTYLELLYMPCESGTGVERAHCHGDSRQAEVRRDAAC